MRREIISSELLMCGGSVRSILLLPLVARYLETKDVCISLLLMPPLKSRCVFVSNVFSLKDTWCYKENIII